MRTFVKLEPIIGKLMVLGAVICSPFVSTAQVVQPVFIARMSFSELQAQPKLVLEARDLDLFRAYLKNKGIATSSDLAVLEHINEQSLEYYQSQITEDILAAEPGPDCPC